MFVNLSISPSGHQCRCVVLHMFVLVGKTNRSGGRVQRYLLVELEQRIVPIDDVRIVRFMLNNPLHVDQLPASVVRR